MLGGIADFARPGENSNAVRWGCGANAQSGHLANSNGVTISTLLLRKRETIKMLLALVLRFVSCTLSG
jgi:hypothetical protein